MTEEYRTLYTKMVALRKKEAAGAKDIEPRTGLQVGQELSPELSMAETRLYGLGRRIVQLKEDLLHPPTNDT